MNTTESIGSFAFPEAGLNGLDPAERASLRRYLAQRERAINRVDLISLRCTGGPLHGQQITLENQGGLNVPSTRTAEMALKGMQGYYRAQQDGMAAWHSTAPTQPLVWSLDNLKKLESTTPQDLDAEDTSCKTLPAAKLIAPTAPKSSAKPLPKTHSQLSAFIVRLHTGQADKFVDTLGNPCEDDEATPEHFAVFRLHRLIYKIKNTPERMAALAAQLIRIRRHLSDKLLPPALEFCRQSEAPQDLSAKAKPCETLPAPQATEPSTASPQVSEQKQPIAGTESVRDDTKTIANTLAKDTIQRINFAAKISSSGSRATRAFDNCFEMGDGQAVNAALFERARKNPATKLSKNLSQYITPINPAKGQPLQEIAMQTTKTTQENQQNTPAASIESAQSATKSEALQDLAPQAAPQTSSKAKPCKTLPEKVKAARHAHHQGQMQRSACKLGSWEAWTQEKDIRGERATIVLFFAGSALKPTHRYRYSTRAKALQALTRFAAGALTNHQRRAETKSKRAQDLKKPIDLAAGDVLVSSWGYDQTNVDWYQVTARFGVRGVELRKIAGEAIETGFMSGQCVLIINQFIGQPMRKNADQYNSVNVLNANYGRAHKADYHEAQGMRVYKAHYHSSYA